MSFTLAQTFYVDPAACKNAVTVNLTQVVLYFRSKPTIDTNRSGLFAPGVEIGIVPTKFSVPLIGQIGLDSSLGWARAEYGTIVASQDASVPTHFRFDTPIPIYTGYEYAIVVKYDGDEDYVLWTSRQGDALVGTTSPSPGASGQYVGKLFTYISPTGATTGTGIGYSGSQTISNTSLIPSTSGQLSQAVNYSQDYLYSTWKALDDVDLKFNVSIARYFHNGVPISANAEYTDNPIFPVWNTSNNVLTIANNVLRAIIPMTPMEFVTFDRTESAVSTITIGDRVFQNQPFFTGGKPSYATCSVAANSTLILGNTSYVLANGANFSWEQLFSRTGYNQNIVVVSENHYGSGNSAVNVRSVYYATANGIVVDLPLTFSNTSAKFFLAPIAEISSQAKSYGILNNGKLADLLILTNSSANSSTRFVNNCIKTIAITANGSGYSNSDYIKIQGYENVGAEVSGGYMAQANIVTNSSGNVTAIYLTNAGAGFVNSSLVTTTIANSTGGTSSGSGLTLSLTYGAVLRTERDYNSTYFGNCSIINLDASHVVPVANVVVPGGTTYSMTHRTLYYSEPSSNTFSGKHYYVEANSSTTDFSVTNYAFYGFSPNSAPSIVSRSNQYSIRFANGATANDSVIGSYTSNTAVYMFDIASNNDFTAVSLGKTEFSSVYDKYIINNDYTNEHTNYGNAWAKHVTTKIAFADGRKAEDMLVYLTGFRPPNTDFKVYARIHNSLDSENFDTKDWTLLEQTDGLGVYSNPANEDDLKEFTYNFRAYPNTDYRSVGTVTTTLSSNAIAGANTNFTANLAVGDLVRVYQPLFPNNYMVGVIGSIVSNVSITLTDPVTNNGIVGSGLYIDRIGYPKQAFNDILSSNVVTYYNSAGERFDAYDSFQVKVVFVSTSDKIVPKVGDIRAVCCSA